MLGLNAKKDVRGTGTSGGHQSEREYAVCAIRMTIQRKSSFRLVQR